MFVVFALLFVYHQMFEIFQLSEVFEQEIDPVMKKLGYCCGRKVKMFYLNAE